MNPALAYQAERLRAMSADEKVRLAHALWVEARQVIEAGVRARQPDWSDEQVAARVRELMRDAGAWTIEVVAGGTPAQNQITSI